MAPSTDWKENVAPGEDARFDQLAAVLLDIQQKRGRKNPIARGLHAKLQASAEGTFTVSADVPEYARVGLAAKPATYRALVRYSNGQGTRGSDQAPDVRGIGVKLVGVPGKKLIPGMEDAATQDFLAILGVATPFSGPDDFVWFVANARNQATLLPRAILRLGFGKATRLIGALLKSGSRKTVSVATERFNSQLPIMWGSYAVRYIFDPLTPADPAAKRGSSPNWYGEELKARLAKGAVEYDFKVQFFVDEQRTPIEDPTIEWKEPDSPWVTIGRLTLPQQDTAKSAELIEGLSFDPWHAPVEHRPLGAMMRARNAAYRLSTRERQAAPEPT